MSQDVAALGYEIDTSGLRDGERALSRFELANRDAARETDRLGDRVDRSGREARQAGREFRGMSEQLQGIVSAAQRVAGAIGVAFGGAAIFRATEDYGRLTNGLLAMGQTAEQAAANLGEITQVALRTRAPLDATAQLYTRISIAAGELGASQQDVLRFTENVGLALGAAGISANEASGALLQLSQAMAGGVVRAEEFNSILENAFPLAQAAARGIDEAGGSVGRLRQLVVDGKISSEEFFAAILSQSEQLQETFGNTSATVGQAVTNLNTSFTQFVGSVNQATGATSAIADAIQFMANNIESVAGVVIAAAIPAVAALSAAFFTLSGAIAATGIGVLVVAAGLLIGEFIKLVRATGEVGEAFTALGTVASETWEGIKTSASSIVPALGSVWEGVKSSFFLMISDMIERWAGFLQTVAGSVASVPGMSGLAESLQGAVTNTLSRSGDFANAGLTASAEADRLSGVASDLLTGGFDRAAAAAKNLSATVTTVTSDTEIAATSAEALANALNNVPTITHPEVGGGVGGSGTNPQEDITALDRLIGNMPDDPYAEVSAWYNEAMTALSDAQLLERGMVEEHQSYLTEIERVYAMQREAIRRNERETDLMAYSDFFGTMASVFQSGGEKTLGIAKAFGVAHAAVSMWIGAAKALELPFPENLAAWAKVLATGAQAIQGIKSAKPGGGATSSAASAAVPSATPERVIRVDFDGPDWARDMFQSFQDQLYENSRDGTRVVFAR